MRSFEGGLEHSTVRGSISSAYVALQPYPGTAPDYFKHLFKSRNYIQALQATTNLVRDGQALRYGNFTQVDLPLPSPAEQQALGRFLDAATAKVDALIAKQERLIELLQENRQAFISNVVTKGLNPDAPMKPSGMKWLGNVPKHWAVMPVRRNCVAIEQGWSPVADDATASEETWAVIKLSAVNRGRFIESEHKALPADIHPEIRYEIKPGDLLLTRANTPKLVGDVCVVGKVRPRLMLCDLVYRLRLRAERLSPRFLCYYLMSTPGRYSIETDARGTSGSMVKISQGHIAAWPVPLPPEPEQRQIVAALEAMDAKQALLIEKCEHSITSLREHRAALISAAVTGKIDVREAATHA
jgi:type I restriction enzyme, S subunit